MAISAISPANRPRQVAARSEQGNLIALQYFLVCFALLMLPVNWLLGVTVPALLAVAIIVVLGYKRPSFLEVVLFGLAGTLVFSLVYNGYGDFRPSRVIAAIYNLIVMGTFVIFLNWGGRLAAFSENFNASKLRDSVYRAAFWTYLIYAAYIFLVFLYVKITRNTSLEFDALIFGRLGNLPGILGQYADNTIITADWINGANQLRIHGFGAYPTDSAVQVVLLGLLACIYCARRNMVWALVLVELSILPALFPIGSRTAGLAYVVSFVMMVSVIPRTFGFLSLILGPVLIAGMFVAFPYVGDFTQGLFTFFTEARAGSTESRLNSYTTAIRTVLDNNVLIGLGIKPFDPFNPGIPIGSHSSVISMFTKGGLVGLAFFLLLFVSLVIRMVVTNLVLFAARDRIDFATRCELVLLCRVIFVWLVWTLTEDFDAPMYPALIAGLSVGLFWALSGRIVKRPARSARPSLHAGQALMR